MPREVPTYRAQFSAVKVLRYRCNICTGNKRLTLRRKQAISHGGSAKHCSKAESEAFFGRPGNFTTLRVTNWLCKTCKDRCGRPMMIMTCEEAKLHEVSRKHYPKVAATFFKHPENFKYVGNGKWLCVICERGNMTVKKAKAHESRRDEAAKDGEAGSRHESCLARPRRSERNNSTTDTHQEGTMFVNDNEDDNEDDNEGEGDDDEELEVEDDDVDNDDNENDNDDTDIR